jgi:hypothetical protein
LGFFLREYNRYFPDFSFRINGTPQGRSLSPPRRHTHQLSIRSLHARAGEALQWMRWYAFGVVTPNRKSKSRRLIAAAERVC